MTQPAVFTPEQLARYSALAPNVPAAVPVGTRPSGGGSLQQEIARLDAETATVNAEQQRLEQENGKTATALTQFTRGALDQILLSGAWLGAGIESLGAATGWQGAETFGRELGDSAQGSEALAALAFAASPDTGTHAYDDTLQTIQDQEKAWPTLSTVSRLAGAAGAAFGTGALASAGLSAVGYAGAQTGMLAAKGLGATAAVAAAEGSAAGAQLAYEQDAPLRDVLTSATMGAVLGGGAAYGVGKAFQKLGASRGAAEAANERALKATGMRGSDIRKIPPEKLNLVGETLRTHKLKDGKPVLRLFDNAEDLAPRLEQATDELGAELGALRKQVAASPVQPDASAFLQRVDQEVLEPLRGSVGLQNQRVAEDVRNRLHGIIDEVNNRSTPVINRATGEQVKRTSGASFEKLMRLRSELQDTVYGMHRQMQGPSPLPAPELNHLLKTERILNDTLDQHASKILPPDQFARYSKVKELYSFLKPAEQGAEKAVGQNLGNRWLSMSDYTAGFGTAIAEAATGNPLGWLQGVAGALVHKQIRERGSAFMAVTYTRLMQDSVAPQVKAMLPLLGKATRTIGARTAALLTAPERAVLTVAQQQQQYNERLDQLAQISAIPQSQDFTKALKGLPVEMQSIVVADYQQKLTQLLQDIPKPRQTIRGTQQLSSQELRKANAMYEATTQPMTVFSDFRTGNVDYDKVKYTWKQYPGLKELSQAALLDVLQSQLDDDHRKKLPDQVLTQLDMLFGFGGKLQDTLNPGFSSRMSAIGAAARNQEQQEQRQLAMSTSQPTYTQRISGKRN